MEEKIKEVMANVLGIDKQDISESTSPDTVEEWDSLKQMNLIVALEEEFDIEFDDDEIMTLISYPSITDTIKANQKSA